MPPDVLVVAGLELRGTTVDSARRSRMRVRRKRRWEVAEFERHVLGRRLGVVIEAEHQVAVRVEPLLALRVREDHASVDRKTRSPRAHSSPRHPPRCSSRDRSRAQRPRRAGRGSHGHNVARLLTFELIERGAAIRVDRPRRSAIRTPDRANSCPPKGTSHAPLRHHYLPLTSYFTNSPSFTSTSNGAIVRNSGNENRYRPGPGRAKQF